MKDLDDIVLPEVASPVLKDPSSGPDLGASSNSMLTMEGNPSPFELYRARTIDLSRVTEN